MRFPLITRSHHEEVLAARDVAIAELRRELEEMRLLAAALPGSVADAATRMVEAIRPPAPTGPRPIVPRRTANERRTEPRKTDYATLDPEDLSAITRMARAELGNAAANASLLLRKVAVIQHRIRMAKKNQLNQEGPVDPNSPLGRAEALIAAAEEGK